MQPSDSNAQGSRASPTGLLRRGFNRAGGFLGWFASWFVLALALLALFILLADWRVESTGSAGIFVNRAELPKVDAALVLGTAKYLAHGKINTYYEARVKAAASLYAAGKVRGIVVSGDNSTLRYNEPQRMKEDLVALGVPSEFITCDYAGFRTLDSVVRMEAVFHMRRYVVVSQDFHVERALYLARAFGQDPVGFVADEPPTAQVLKVRVREKLARAMAVLDVNVFGRGPKFLGEPVKVGLAPEKVLGRDGI